MEKKRTKAVNTFSLVGTDNHIFQSGTFLENEDGISIAPFRLSSARAGATIKASIRSSGRVG
jgi:hypothetical protein